MEKRYTTTILLSALILSILCACGGNGTASEENIVSGQTGYPVLDSYIAHFDNMIKILSDNKNEIEKALRELLLYQEKYGLEIKKLEEEITSTGASDPKLLSASVKMLSSRHEQLSLLRDELVKRTLQ